MRNAADFYARQQAEQNDRDLKFQDDYRKSQIDQFTTTKQNIQKALAAGQILDPATKQLRPLSEDEISKLNDASGKIDLHLKRLYDPNVNPMKNAPDESILHKLTTAVHITKPVDTKTPGQQLQDLNAIQQKYGMSAPGTDEALVGQRKRAEMAAGIEQSRELGKKYGLDDEALDEITTHALGVPASSLRDKWKVVHGSIDGERVTVQQNERTGQLRYMSGEEVPDEIAKAFLVDLAAGRGPTANDKMWDAYIGDLVKSGELPSGTTYDKLTPEQRAGFPRWVAEQRGSGVTTQDVVRYEKQADGTIIPVRTINTSSKSFPALPGRTATTPAAAPAAATPSASTPGATPSKPAVKKTPGQQKSDLKAIQEKHSGGLGGRVQVGTAFGKTKDEADTEIDYQAAIDRKKLMHQNLKDALNGDQQAMLSLLAQHLGMTMSLQKGARLNQTIIDEAQKSRPWLEGIKAKFDDRGYLTGVVLSPEQMQQMVKLADEKVTNMREHLDRVKRGGPSQGEDDDVEAIVKALGGK